MEMKTGIKTLRSQVGSVPSPSYPVHTSGKITTGPCHCLRDCQQVPTISDKKCSEFCTFLPTRMPIPWIWYLCGPSPCPMLVKVVESESEMISPDFNIAFLGGMGGVLFFVVVGAFKSFMLKLDISQHKFCTRLYPLSFSFLPDMSQISEMVVCCLFHLHLRSLEHLTHCRCQKKGSTFSSAISIRPS